MAQEAKLSLSFACAIAGLSAVFCTEVAHAATDKEACLSRGAILPSRIEACTRWYKSASGKAAQANALAARANAYLAFAKRDEAMIDARAALMANPAEPLATWIVAIVLNRQGDRAAALAMYSQTIALRPKHAPPRVERAVLHRMLGNTGAARIDVNEALRLDPRSVRAYCERAALNLAVRDAASALTDASRGLELAPNDSHCRLQRAQAMLAQGQSIDALVDAEFATSIAPRLAEGHLVVGRIHSSLGKTAEAAASFERYFALLSERVGQVGVVYRSSHDFTVIYVSPRSPAEESRIQTSDIVTSIDGQRTGGTKGLPQLKQNEIAAPGSVVALEVLSAANRTRRLTLTRRSHWNDVSTTDIPSALLMGTIGVKLAKNDGQAVIAEVLQNSPAHRAGLVAGDRIVSVDGVFAARLSLRATYEKMRGPAGSSVVIEFISVVGAQSKRVTILRQADTTSPIRTSHEEREPEQELPFF